MKLVELTKQFGMLQDDLVLAMARHKERTGQSATIIVLGKTEWELMRTAVEMRVTDVVGVSRHGATGLVMHMVYRGVGVVREVSGRPHGIGVFSDWERAADTKKKNG